jgi:hypothetical protein
MINYGLFFVGLNDNAYFWEVFINNARKVVFIMSSTLLTSLNSTVKVTLLLNPLVSLGHLDYLCANEPPPSLPSLHRPTLQPS